MARAQAVQIQCDRCKRTYLVPAAQAAEKTEPDFVAKLGDQEIVFNDLDEPCKATLRGLWDNIKEWKRELNQHLVGQGPMVGANQAPPVSSTPDYSPPKPHSAAAAHR